MKITVLVLALAMFLAFSGILPKAIAPNTVGDNYKNVTVQTRVNISNSKPDILNLTIYEALNVSSSNITLSAGNFKRVYCNATVRDWDGANDIRNATGVLWNLAASTISASDNNNTHYTNISCTLNQTISTYIKSFVCSFDVVHYANNGTWNCSVNVTDFGNKTDMDMNNTYFYPLYSLNVTDGIDYGNVAVEDYSVDKTANLTNLGNMAINISVEGYGVTRGDGLAMNCSITGNITVGNERFSTNSAEAYATKTPLVTTLGGTLIPGLIMSKQINSTLVTNTTYWQLYIPPNPAGNCTGYIIFSAVAP